MNSGCLAINHIQVDIIERNGKEVKVATAQTHQQPVLPTPYYWNGINKNN